MMPSITIRYRLKIYSRTNQRGHWSKQHRRSKSERQLAYLKMSELLSQNPQWRERIKTSAFIHFTLTRLRGYYEKPFDSDNLVAAFKSTRDGICDAIGIDDRSDRLSFRCKDARSDTREAMIEIFMTTETEVDHDAHSAS